MDLNYTPIDLEKLKSNSNNKINTILLIIATITAGVLALLLFVLIQKKTKPIINTIPSTIVSPTITTIPTIEEIMSSPSATPRITEKVATPTAAVVTPQASGSATPSL